MLNIDVAMVSDLVNMKRPEIVKQWSGMDAAVVCLDRQISQKTNSKIKAVAGEVGIRVMTITTQELDLFEAEMTVAMDSAMEKNPELTDLDDLGVNYWVCMMKAVPEINDYEHSFFTPTKPYGPEQPAEPKVKEMPTSPLSTLGAVVQASAMVTDTIKLVSDNPQVEKEPRKMYSQSQVDEIVDKAVTAATAPLYETLKRFEVIFDKMNEEAELQGAAKNEPPALTVVTEELLPEPVDLSYGLRARHAAIVTERSEVHDKWMAALRDRDKEAQKMYRERFDALSDERKKIEADPTFRSTCADLLHAGADSTRKYGHKTVDAVADVMHKAVDITANSMDKVGNMVDKKDRLTTD